MPPGAQPRPGQPPGRPRPGGPGGPGRRPGAAPDLPEGHPPIIPKQAGTKTDEHAGKGTHEGGHEGGHSCHGPGAPTAKINWWQGLLGVNNKRANGSFLDRLLFRYNNTANECDPRNQEPPVLASLINLGIVILILMRFGRKPIVDALHKRKKTIMQDIDAATALKVDAEKRLKGYEKQLARIEDRRKELREEFRKQSEAERDRILKEAEEKAARQRRDAEFRVEQERKQAQTDLLREAVDQAVAAAESLVRSRIQAQDQERLADEYLAGIGSALKQENRRTT